MIRRLVKMTFRQECIQQFRSLFEKQKDRIRSFEGCEHLELWQDEKDARIFFTYSHWQDEAALDNYRESDLFKAVWQETKALFDARPEAWSTIQVAQGSAM